MWRRTRSVAACRSVALDRPGGTGRRSRPRSRPPPAWRGDRTARARRTALGEARPGPAGDARTVGQGVGVRRRRRRCSARSGRRYRPTGAGSSTTARPAPWPSSAATARGRRAAAAQGQLTVKRASSGIGCDGEGERRDDPEVATTHHPGWPRTGRRSRSALAVSSRPSAVTVSRARRLSQVRPYFRPTTPMPPPRVSPAMPTDGHEPAGRSMPALDNCRRRRRAGRRPRSTALMCARRRS